MAVQFHRRRFLQSAAALGAAPILVATSTRANDLNGRLRVASIGCGGKGQDDLQSVAASPRVEVVALCNVDQTAPHLGWAAEQFPKARRFQDFRRLLEVSNEFDAVIVSTPDHMHAPISLAAMSLGKHVFCQKPLTHTVEEARKMRQAAERYRVVTQMGNQIQSDHTYRSAVKLIRDGAIGKVREVHSWQNGPVLGLRSGGRPKGSNPIPTSLAWDLWLGAAPKRPYLTDVYHPRNWRAWQDFGCGQLGDFGCHIMDPVFMALDLKAPTSLEADSPKLDGGMWGPWCKVAYEFRGNDRTAGETLPLTWYDGGKFGPERDALGLPKGYALPEAGSAIVGEEGTMVLPHWADPQLSPKDKFASLQLPVVGDVNHYTSWVDACLGDGKTTSNFAYAGPLTETVLLGTIAIRFPGERLVWDAEEGRFIHHADANTRLTKQYRKGWELAG
jgi:predicted dehydrogenase